MVNTMYHDLFGDYGGTILIPADWHTDATDSWGIVCYVIGADAITTIEIGFIEE